MPAVLDRRVSKAEAKRLDRVLDPFEQAGRYVVEHEDELIDQFEDEWIAVLGDEVIAHHPSRRALNRQLIRQRQPLSQVYVEYLTRKKQTLIL